jgi:hypothetical protein
LYVNKISAARYGQGLTGQKSTSCGGDQRLKSEAYVSDVQIVIQVNRLKILT